MKKIILLLFLGTTISYAQTKSVSIEYGLIIEKEVGLFDNNATLKSFLEKSMVDCKTLTFQLVITKNGSKFLNEENLEKDSNVRVKNFILAMAHYSGVVYSLKDKIMVQQKLIGDKFYAEEELKDKWGLSNETKMIDNYLCYKATNAYKVTNGTKVFNHPVTAWYCPQLPYRYGPIGYGNLPGLILELQVRNAVFGVKSIDFNSKLNFDTKELDQIKILSAEELNQAYNKMNSFED
jgi:GLPGLI family protein